MPITNYPKEHQLILGIQPELPLRNFPPGRIKIILRPQQFAKACIRTNNNHFYAFYIQEKDDHWEPSYPIATTIRQVLPAVG